MPNRRRKNKNRRRQKKARQAAKREAAQARRAQPPSQKPNEAKGSKQGPARASQKRPAKPSTQEVFFVKKVTGKYSCSISELNGPLKTLRPGARGGWDEQSPSKQGGGQSRGRSVGSRAPESENSKQSKNLSEMSLILTPLQVKLKREGFSQSARNLASLKSRFGSTKQTEPPPTKGPAPPCSQLRTALERMATRDSGKRKQSGNLTQRTDLSGSGGSFAKMFRELKISPDSEENWGRAQKRSAEPFSQKSGSPSLGEQKCFLDERLEDSERAPFRSFLNRGGRPSRDAEPQRESKGAARQDSQATRKRLSKEALWRSAGSSELNEQSSELKGGFHLRRIIENPGLFPQSRRSAAFRETLEAQAMVG